MATRIRTKRGKDPSATQVRLKPADSFDLISLLARTQSDARKAVAELVQNSFDAGARRIDVTWLREKGATLMRIVDDGTGIFPELPREEALRRIATTIGHSHKRDLTPIQRRELMLAGKYGIGLLGFWAVGKTMAITSRIEGGETWCLTMHEDSPHAELARAPRRRLHETDTFTEVTIRGISPAAARQVRPGRLQAYLANELRGQLLDREVELCIHDRVARGLSMKEFRVQARRFQGRPLGDLDPLVVPGHEEARVELYLVDEDAPPGRVTLACGGTSVLDDLADVDGTGEPRTPWDSGRFEGVIDFPELEVVPGTRRGLRMTEAAIAFLEALAALEERLRAILAEEARRQHEERDRNLAKEIRRVFRPVARELPLYDLFDLSKDAGTATPSEGASSGAGLPEVLLAGPAPDPAEDEDAGVALFPPGPLFAVTISPSKARLPCGVQRQFKARPRDADGRLASGGVEFSWTLDGPGALSAEGGVALYTAPVVDASVSLNVTATQGEVIATSSAAIRVSEDIANPARDSGIPEPVPIKAPAEPWRSRIRENRWEYNTGHKDYAAASAEETRRLRYLVHLFAKEVIVRNFGGPGSGDLLERMVEILTYLGDGRPAQLRRPPPGPSAAADAGNCA